MTELVIDIVLLIIQVVVVMFVVASEWDPGWKLGEKHILWVVPVGLVAWMVLGVAFTLAMK